MKNKIICVIVLCGFISIGYSQFVTTPIQWSCPDYAENTDFSSGNNRNATIDMNGDGQPDYVETRQNGLMFGTTGNHYWQVYLNNGNGFDATPIQWSCPDYAENTAWFSGNNRNNTIDMNGDGQPDYVETRQNGLMFGTTGNHYWQVYLNTNSNLSIDKKEKLFNSLVYPNPTNNDFVIDLGSVSSETQIKITDVYGKLYLDQKFSQKQVLDLSISASKGVYFVQIITPMKKDMVRLIVE